MKHFLLILTVFLSCIFGDSDSPFLEHSERTAAVLVEAAAQEGPEDNPNYGSPALLPVQAAGYSGESTVSTPSGSTINSTRRTQVSHRSPFRIFKAGKIIDRRYYHCFQIEINQFDSGINSPERFIHSICQLLI